MRLTWRDGLATVFVGGAAALYGFWMTDSEVIGLTTTRAVAAVVLVLGMAGCFAARSFFEAMYSTRGETSPPMAYVVLVSSVGLVALVAALVALIGSSTAALTTLVVAMVVLWALATVRHLAMTRTHNLAAVH